MTYNEILLIEKEKNRYYICISYDKNKSTDIFLDLLINLSKNDCIDICDSFDNTDNEKKNTFYDIVILGPNDKDYTRIDEVLKQLTDFGSYHDKFYILINDKKNNVYPLFKILMDRLKYVDTGGCSSTNITEIYYIEDIDKLSEEILKLIDENEEM